MGVLDLLPHAVSAVYFMYHESVNDLGFGKLGAMREIAMAKESGYRWWYAGFYIHTCKKMRYKGDYSPQYILDPESYLWYLFSKDIKNQLDTSKYLGFSKEKSEASEHLSNAISASSPCESTEQEGSTANNRISDLDEDDVPVFATGMPGILTRDELLSQVDLNEVIIEVDNMRTKASCLIGWQKSNIDSNLSVKGFIAGLVATVGPDLLSKIVIKLR
ncbi:BgTH12-03615 [Blumeria graminis f. sp. triticale]|uniref:BgTH12-03615 n=1 Tax=Blumeria graminis f. sp. triticale TaxID=1689686 RepID=A0A9W4CVG7_BLUGR|nr:BgTH12-03615 [Blumeria graminis f. sp. triticale]